MKKAFICMVCIISVLVVFSCASKPSSAEKVKLERQQRAYERLLKEITIDDKAQLERAGMYYFKKQIWVVISLSDSGVDSFPEWAAKKLLSKMMSYDVIEAELISEEEYSELVLMFEEVGFIEGSITNISQVVIKEKDLQRFRKTYAEDN